MFITPDIIFNDYSIFCGGGFIDIRNWIIDLLSNENKINGNVMMRQFIQMKT